jgi:hypothetical protein
VITLPAVSPAAQFTRCSRLWKEKPMGQRLFFMLTAIWMVHLVAATAMAQQPLCIYAVSPTPIYFEAGGGSQEAQVKASSPDCSFEARTSYRWIQVSPSRGGAGSVVTIQVEPHRALSPRVGSVLVDGTQIEIIQKAANLMSW